MTADYPTWRAERFRELDALKPKIDELPPNIRQALRGYVNVLRERARGVHTESPFAGVQVKEWVQGLARELDLITVAPASEDGEVK
jgi:hypothetical protein